MTPLQLRCMPTVFLFLFCLALPACAATIFFGMSLIGNTLTLTNQGDGTVFYPVVLRLLHDGRWEALAPPAGIEHSAVLLPGAALDLEWPTAPPQQQAFSLEMFRPVMVRFFDEGGSGFGQISFFMQPPEASAPVGAYYEDGLLTIEPPAADSSDAIRASWLLWPKEEGITPLAAALAFEHDQPPAQRIEWRAGMAPLRFDLGAGLPAAMLLHETSNGFTFQRITGGDQPRMQQRTAWLNAKGLFYKLAGGCAAGASVLLLWLLAGARRKGRAA
jgi:hypothetical protein